MNIVNGSSGNDTLVGTGADDFIDGAGAADRMIGGAGNDVYAVDDAGDVVVELLGEGTDRVNASVDFALPAWVEDLWLVGIADVSGTGNGLANVMWGNAGRNALAGGAGDDVLDGAAGADTLTGGAGDDTYWVDDAGDSVRELAGEGVDVVRSALAAFALPANVENLVLLAGAGDVSGVGNALDNALTGNEGRNALDGAGGRDSLDGGAGADTMSGGTGDDAYRVDDAGDVVLEQPGEGADSVWSSLPSYLLPANVENLHVGFVATGTQALDGTGNGLDNELWGNAGDNRLDGGAGDDLLRGASGNDTLTGGPGVDAFCVSTGDVGTDVITDLQAGETIEVCGAFFFTPTVSAGDGTSLGAGQVQVATGSARTTLYVGTDDTPGADVSIVLDGRYGADDFSLFTDLIRYDTNHAPRVDAPMDDRTGIAGTSFGFRVPAGTFADPDAGDALTYGAQLFDIDEGPSALPGWLAFDPATHAFSAHPTAANVGTWYVLVTATDSHGASTSDAFALDVTPAGIVGGARAEVLNGTAAGEWMYGLAGNDTMSGGDGNDVLLGGDGDDSVSGGRGNDVLDAGAGADRLAGGKGDDLYRVDLVRLGGRVVLEDAVAELSGEGTDTLALRAADGLVAPSAAFTLTLDRALENLDLSATGLNAIGARGNTAANVLTGNAAANALNGDAGNDTIDGGAGADVLTGGAGRDVFAFSCLPGAGGADRITDYSVADDTIRFDHASFGALGPIGALAPQAFWRGAGAHDADDRVVYDAASGALLYDADGNGACAAVTIALIGTGLAMTSAEFTIA